MASKLEPCLIVIFGATGDLAHRKILPALYQMTDEGQLPGQTIILGVGRNKGKTDAAFRNEAHLSIQQSIGSDFEKISEWCEERIFYYGIGSGTREDFAKLRAKILSLEKKHKLSGNRIFHLAIPPQSFGPTIKALGTVS